MPSRWRAIGKGLTRHYTSLLGLRVGAETPTIFVALMAGQRHKGDDRQLVVHGCFERSDDPHLDPDLIKRPSRYESATEAGVSTHASHGLLLEHTRVLIRILQLVLLVLIVLVLLLLLVRRRPLLLLRRVALCGLAVRRRGSEVLVLRRWVAA